MVQQCQSQKLKDCIQQRDRHLQKNDIREAATWCNKIGKIFSDQNKHEHALQAHEQELKLSAQIKDKLSQASICFWRDSPSFQIVLLLTTSSNRTTMRSNECMNELYRVRCTKAIRCLRSFSGRSSRFKKQVRLDNDASEVEVLGHFGTIQKTVEGF